jgi:hypothetical protein
VTSPLVLGRTVSIFGTMAELLHTTFKHCTYTIGCARNKIFVHSTLCPTRCRKDCTSPQTDIPLFESKKIRFFRKSLTTYPRESFKVPIHAMDSTTSDESHVGSNVQIFCWVVFCLTRLKLTVGMRITTRTHDYLCLIIFGPMGAPVYLNRFVPTPSMTPSRYDGY